MVCGIITCLKFMDKLGVYIHYYQATAIIMSIKDT